MKTSLIHSVASAVIAISLNGVEGRGWMTQPAARAITNKYRTEGYAGIRGAGDMDIQLSSLEDLLSKKQEDRGAQESFDVMNGCRGTVYENGQPAPEYKYDTDISVKLSVQSPNAGKMELNVVKKKAENGKTTYGSVQNLLTDGAFGAVNGDVEKKVKIPTSVTGCDKAGECALQFSWKTNSGRSFVTCSDFIIKAPAPAPTPAPTPAPSPTVTPAPNEEDDDDFRGRLRDYSRHIQARQ